MIQYIFAAAVLVAMLNEPTVTGSGQYNGLRSTAYRTDIPERKKRTDVNASGSSRKKDTLSEIDDSSISGIQSQNNKTCNLDCSAIPGSRCVDGMCTDPYYTMFRR